MTRETRLKRDILQAIRDYSGNKCVLTPGQLLDMVKQSTHGEYEDKEFYGCLRRMAEEGLIGTPQELNPLLQGNGLSGTIGATLSSAGQSYLDNLNAD